jgi:hypothetical protein
MLVIKARTYISQKLGVISSNLHERRWRRRGYGYDPALLTSDVKRDIGAITACLNRVHRAANRIRTLDTWCYRWNVRAEWSLRIRQHLLKKEHQAVVQSKQHLTTVIQDSMQPNGALVKLLSEMSEREISLSEDLVLLGI